MTQDENIKRRKLKPTPLLDGVEEIRQDFEERIAQGDTTYGLEILDDYVETIREGSVTFIIAAPNTGKSICSQLIAVNLAKQGKKVLICSCEMGAGLLMERQLKNLTGTSMKQLRELYSNRRDVANRIMDSIIEDAKYNYLKNIYICETAGATVEDLIELYDIYPEYEYIIVDFIQSIAGKGTEYEVISNAAVTLQSYARMTRKRMIICSQASRASVSDSTQNKSYDGMRLKGKGSGAIEERGDVGLSLMEDFQGGEKYILMTLFKNRYGAGKNITYRYKLDSRLNFVLQDKVVI